jgi:transposase, IS5 family
MRVIIDPQAQFGEVNIADIQLDPKSRDDIPQLLRGLQYIYTSPDLRERVFKILEEVRPIHEGAMVSAEIGRPGMEQWKILVLGILRLGLNIDYDRVHELANQHKTIREMLGHSGWFDETVYTLDTIKNNLRLFTPEILDLINQEVVAAGHQLVKKNPEEKLSARCDSFVVETDVHYPTDINLLLDAIRKTIETCATLSKTAGNTEWRQSAYLIRKLKKLYRNVQRMKHSTSKDEAKRQARRDDLVQAYTEYLGFAKAIVARAKGTRWDLGQSGGHLLPLALVELDGYLGHAERQIDQVTRRVLQGETIPHHEKVFSIFEPHSEWISKGKAGVPVELGLPVCIVEDQYRFILHHQVMEKTTDVAIAVQIVQATKERFSDITSISMDKGFHSPENQGNLANRVDCVVVPKKGRLSKADQKRENNPEFIEKRRAHSAVESAINALEVHGLDRCLDHGIDGFKRYVALAVVARNIQRLGALLREQEQKEFERRARYKKAA